MIKKILENLYLNLRYPYTVSYFNFVKKQEFSSIPHNRRMQQMKLYKIVIKAIKNVPYYQQVAQETNFKINHETVFEDLKKLPILTKDIVRNRFNDLKSTQFKGKFSKNSSGGSTGEPVVFLQDKKFYQAGEATKQLFYRWAGRGYGDKIIKVWGSPIDIFKGGQGLAGWFLRNIRNVYILNAYTMTNAEMQKYIDLINSKKPKVLEIYVQTIVELCKYVKKNNIKIYSPPSIVTSAGSLFKEHKEIIKGIFDSKIYNRYGSRETGDMAVSCEKGEGLHLNLFNQYIEILDDDLQPVEPGESGDIYVTTLTNTVMPLIRFKIQDIAQLSKNQQCSCGRGLPLINNVIGRSHGIMKKRNGDFVDGGFLTLLIFYMPWIKKFQAIQKDYDQLEFKIVLEDEPIQKDMDYITKNTQMVMGKSCQVKFNFVDDIPATRSGKFLYTQSLINNT